MSQGAESVAPAPGTGEEVQDPTPPAAEPTTPERQGPPETIPYGRFKEVNDALRPFKELEDLGYSADDLRQLADWDSAFQTDPAGTWLQIAGQLPDMPDSVKTAIAQHLSEGKEESPTPTEAPSEPKKEDEEPPAWAKEIIEWKAEREKQEEDEAFDEMLEGVMEWWRGEDKKQGITTPDKVMLDLIIAQAGHEHESIESMQEAARSSRLALREIDLKPVTERSGAPAPVPGGGGTPPNRTATPKTLSEASAAARQFLQNAQKEEA